MTMQGYVRRWKKETNGREMARRKRTDEKDEKFENQIDSIAKKKSRKKSEKSPFLLSRTTYQNFTDDEKKQADAYIQKGEWEVVSTGEDLAHDFLIYMLLRDCVKNGYFIHFLDTFVDQYRREHPQNYENLIKRFISILENTHISREEVEVMIRSYQETLSNV